MTTIALRPARGSAPPGTRGTIRSARAFTLVELLCALTVVVVLAAIAMPRYTASLAHFRLDSAAKRIQADMTWARESAKSASAPRSITFDPGNNRYTLDGVTDPDNPLAPYLVRLGAAPYHVELVSADFGGELRLSYNGFGVPGSGGSVVVRVGRFVRIVTLDGVTAAAAAATEGDAAAMRFGDEKDDGSEDKK